MPTDLPYCIQIIKLEHNYLFFLASLIHSLKVSSSHFFVKERKYLHLTLCECQVAFVSQWGVYEFGSVTLVLVGVVKFCIYHPHYTQAIPFGVEPGYNIK